MDTSDQLLPALQQEHTVGEKWKGVRREWIDNTCRLLTRCGEKKKPQKDERSLSKVYGVPSFKAHLIYMLWCIQINSEFPQMSDFKLVNFLGVLKLGDWLSCTTFHTGMLLPILLPWPYCQNPPAVPVPGQKWWILTMHGDKHYGIVSVN